MLEQIEAVEEHALPNGDSTASKDAVQINGTKDTEDESAATWFILDIIWYKRWRRFVKNEENNGRDVWHGALSPLPIDNSNLVNCLEFLNYDQVLLGSTI